jgi:hypothetical protein
MSVARRRTPGNGVATGRIADEPEGVSGMFRRPFGGDKIVALVCGFPHRLSHLVGAAAMLRVSMPREWSVAAARARSAGSLTLKPVWSSPACALRFNTRQ